MAEEVDDNATQEAINALVGKSTLDWLRGVNTDKPVELKQLGDDFQQKVNWYLGCMVIQQYSRIPTLLSTINEVSAQLQVVNVGMTDPKALGELYKVLTGDVKNIMEFAQKFAVQNKELLTDNASFFDRQLFEKIKSLSVEQIRDYLTLFQIVEAKGSNVLKEIIEKYK